MPTHDIIDNRREKLVDHIRRMLGSTEYARFAVGYFFLSGLESIAARLEGVTELRLLIGNTTSRETVEQLAEGYRRLELVQDALEAQAYPKHTEMTRMASATAQTIRSGMEHMDQTDASEALVKTLVRMIEEKRLKVRVYTRGRLHAKAYIFDYYPTMFDRTGKPVEQYEKGIAVVGSSNLTISGVSHNTELNVVVQGNDNHAALVDMWERVNEVYQLNARVLSMGYLRGDDDGAFNFLVKDAKYRDRDFVLMDESHNLRNPDTQRYKVMQSFLASGKRCCFLTATPRNKSAWDVYYQIKLFHQDDKTDLPVDPPVLKDYFRLIEKGERKLPDLLANILIRRTRNHILRWYGYDSVTDQPLDPARFKDYLDGERRAYVLVGERHQYFPRRVLETIEYSIEDAYQGLYQELRAFIGKPRTAAPPRSRRTN